MVYNIGHGFSDRGKKLLTIRHFYSWFYFQLSQIFKCFAINLGSRAELNISNRRICMIQLRTWHTKQIKEAHLT